MKTLVCYYNSNQPTLDHCDPDSTSLNTWEGPILSVGQSSLVAQRADKWLLRSYIQMLPFSSPQNTYSSAAKVKQVSPNCSNASRPGLNSTSEAHLARGSSVHLPASTFPTYQLYPYSTFPPMLAWGHGMLGIETRNHLLPQR